MSKEEKKGPPEKQYYSVQVEAMIPATLRYRILAESPEQAVELSLRTAPQEPPKFKLHQMRRKAVRVYSWGTNMLKHIKNF